METCNIISVDYSSELDKKKGQIVNLSILTNNATLQLKSQTLQNSKIYHNIDKDLLEFWTTNKHLKETNCNESLKTKLEVIHFGMKNKAKLRNDVREPVWEEIKSSNQDVIQFFTEKSTSKFFDVYLLENYLPNKIKRLRKFDFTRLAELLCEAYQNEQQTLLSALKIKKCLQFSKIQKYSDNLIEKIGQLFSNQLILGLDELEKKLEELFELDIIENQIYKIFYLLVNRDEVCKRLIELVKARLIMQHLQTQNGGAKKKGSTTKRKTTPTNKVHNNKKVKKQ